MPNINFASNIVINNHVIMKDGYIKLPFPIEIADEWLNEPSLLKKEISHKEYIFSELQKYLDEKDTCIETLEGRYAEISDLLISRVWSYHLFKDQVKLDRLMTAYKEMCAECTVQALLFIISNTPDFGMKICLKK